MKEKNIILAARAISMVFTPFYLPLVGLSALFTFSYMSLLPWQYKASVLLTVYVFTVLLPSLFIRTYRRYQGWTLTQLGIKERRMIPYILAIICYFACYYLMNMRRIPQFMSNILLAALVIQVVCAIINVWRKIMRELPTMPAIMRIRQNHHNGLKVNNIEKAIKAPAKPPIAAV